jgi:hypothetical protein
MEVVRSFRKSRRQRNDLRVAALRVESISVVAYSVLSPSIMIARAGPVDPAERRRGGHAPCILSYRVFGVSLSLTTSPFLLLYFAKMESARQCPAAHQHLSHACMRPHL